MIIKDYTQYPAGEISPRISPMDASSKAARAAGVPLGNKDRLSRPSLGVAPRLLQGHSPRWRRSLRHFQRGLHRLRLWSFFNATRDADIDQEQAEAICQ